ncbi:MAG: Hsp70 family protein [Cellvibrionaceae bacterium]
MAVIGIDLGTTNSACGVWREGAVELIPNRLGEYLTPSVVGLNDAGEVIVGRAARERMLKYSERTVAAFKRLMGTNHNIKLGRQKFSAIELSALVLKSLKQDAEEFLGEPVTDAVISVPAYFNDNQRHATKAAGELAGLNVNRLINEPTAAAIAYGLHDKKEATYLVLDMGGGTFDVSILEFFDGVMEVHASAGDNFLGGEDFVDAMVVSVLREFNLTSSQLNAQQLQALSLQMENLKCSIGQCDERPLTLELNKKSVLWCATQTWFLQTISALLLRAKRPIEQAMRDANIHSHSIDEVVLVGGSTRMAAFRSMVGKMFSRLPVCHLDPDTVVAVGAAIQAGMIHRGEDLDDIVLTDVCPYTLGTGVLNRDVPEKGDYFLPIIERNSIVPSSIVSQVCTAHDNQKELLIKIYQGENRYVEKNILLGEMSVKVPKAKEGHEVVDIRYSYDMSGLLEVDVTVISTGECFSKAIQNSPGSLTEAELTQSKNRLKTLKFHPRERDENLTVLSRAERVYETSLGERREQVAMLLAEFEHALEGQNPSVIIRKRVTLDEILDRFEAEAWF